jgi:hypothetical protein
MSPAGSHFDAHYYERFYENQKTRIISPDAQRREVAFVLSFCRHIGLTVDRFADAGAGTGWWAREFALQCRGCRVIETFDASRDACEQYGHRRVPLQKLSGRQADLVVCRDVLRYLDNDDADEAIKRLAKKCRGVLYLHVVTREDLDDVDEEASDMGGWFRSLLWYRRRFDAAGFIDCGMGLLVSPRFRSFNPWRIDTRR